MMPVRTLDIVARGYSQEGDGKLPTNDGLSTNVRPRPFRASPRHGGIGLRMGENEAGQQGPGLCSTQGGEHLQGPADHGGGGYYPRRDDGSCYNRRLRSVRWRNRREPGRRSGGGAQG